MAAPGRAKGPEKVVHTEPSIYRKITVYESEGERCIRFGRERAPRQTCISLKDPGHLVFNYTKMMLAALYLHPEPRRILIIGLGGGTLATTLSAIFPEAEIDTVEIDPAVVRVAQRYFGFRVSDRVRVAEEDGRAFVRRAAREGESFDIVMLDAFEQEYIPEHLLTREFLTEVKSVLTPEGVLAANTWSSSRLYDRESETYESVFGRFFSLRKVNRVILARKDGVPSKEMIRENAYALDKRLGSFGVWSQQLLPLFSMNRDWRHGAPILTDRGTASRPS
ncbi:fused MFS/spermidine synthase [Geomonas sp. RF6]|uniref:spermidine synthase n=1 Tax=Geomonas sp. RF6 TaxID=2897342 RepID=UPI001E3149C2|nr:fused MFS/spermidine synthase [Geomonas sp. RF6]UFS69384.1 fused MFS/spermidine synthase [Geomonas sp. RF6]